MTIKARLEKIDGWIKFSEGTDRYRMDIIYLRNLVTAYRNCLYQIDKVYEGEQISMSEFECAVQDELSKIEKEGKP